jgi:hypothetical protein
MIIVIEPVSSLHCSEEFAISPCPKPQKSVQARQCKSSDPFQYVLSIYVSILTAVYVPRGFRLKYCMHFMITMHALWSAYLILYFITLILFGEGCTL